MGYPIRDHHNTVAAWVGMRPTQEQLSVFRRLLNEGYSIAVWEGDFSGALYLGDVGKMAALMQAINTELWLSDRVSCNAQRVRYRCERTRRTGGKVDLRQLGVC